MAFIDALVVAFMKHIVAKDQSMTKWRPIMSSWFRTNAGVDALSDEAEKLNSIVEDYTLLLQTIHQHEVL